MRFLSGQTKLSGVGRAGFPCTCYDFIDYKRSWNNLLLETSPAAVRTGKSSGNPFTASQVLPFSRVTIFRVFSAGLTFGMSYGKGCKRVLNFGL